MFILLYIFFDTWNVDGGWNATKERQDYLHCVKSILWLLMPWQHKEVWHHHVIDLQWNLYNETGKVLRKTHEFHDLSGKIFTKSCLFSPSTTKLDGRFIQVSLYFSLKYCAFSTKRIKLANKRTRSSFQTEGHWTLLNVDDDSILVQVMAWCLMAPSHYLEHRWLSSVTSYIDMASHVHKSTHWLLGDLNEILYMQFSSRF